MIRGGHVNIAVLGVRTFPSLPSLDADLFPQAMEVSQAGDIANFMIPGKLIKGTWHLLLALLPADLFLFFTQASVEPWTWCPIQTRPRLLLS